MEEQRRGRAIAMTADERDGFLRTQPVCRVATVGPDGRPHTSALWFVWDGSALWLNSLTRSRRWTDQERDPRISVIVDDGGTDFMRLRGVELLGSVEIVGEVPRKGEPSDVLSVPERLFADKYAGGGEFRHDGRHGWLRLLPEKVVSWDFAKLRG
ncbi:pyridoxamine 5-phosphate oxidase [Actinomadura sp. CNU-125]|uniref:pyridoxamine 5'-phosphate oxidase family protein n=1 Tax=Actinomadura sp. CNU-125 TaxID=1904961 RepID=UPI00096368A0|nr:pyridoxamine 5'-phosphate oxidase family protein [Actinomadura sp. CNU-125]OLT31422.1 pyridoxamine 5-phosphate oxidase [Actinomadura sp. CNU-125]